MIKTDYIFSNTRKTTQAIQNLKPNSEFNLKDGVLEWFGTFNLVSTKECSVGVGTSVIVGINTDDLSTGFRLRNLDGLISVGTTVINVGINSITINPSSVNTGIKNNIKIDFGTFDESKPTIEEIEAEKSRIIADEPLSKIRRKRNGLLSQSDYSVLKIIEASLANGKPVGIPSSWVTYRQQLRDFPENVIDPLNPIYPVAPTEEQTNQELYNLLNVDPDWKEFLKGLMQTNVFTSVRQLSRVDVGANAIATELRTSLGEAAFGFAEPIVIQSLFDELSSSLSQSELTEIDNLVQLNRIPITVSVGVGTT